MKDLFDKGFSRTNQKSGITRAKFILGAPLDIDGTRYSDKQDRKEEQAQDLVDFTLQIENILNQEGTSIITYVTNSPYWFYVYNQDIERDKLFIAGIVLFVWAYVTLHTRSCFLSSCAILNVIFSFPITLVVYRLILGIEQVSSLHILAIFIVIGVAADDVFVFTDAWYAAGRLNKLKGDKEKQMAYAWRKAATAILITSLTTAIAFMATAFSVIMPIASFGIFSAVVVPVNFILVVLVYPPMLIIKERFKVSFFLSKHECSAANVLAERKEAMTSRAMKNKKFLRKNLLSSVSFPINGLYGFTKHAILQSLFY